MLMKIAVVNDRLFKLKHIKQIFVHSWKGGGLRISYTSDLKKKLAIWVLN